MFRKASKTSARETRSARGGVQGTSGISEDLTVVRQDSLIETMLTYVAQDSWHTLIHSYHLSASLLNRHELGQPTCIRLLSNLYILGNW